MSTLSRRLLSNVIRLRGVGQLGRMSTSQPVLINSQLMFNRLTFNFTPMRQFSSNKDNDNNDPPVNESTLEDRDIYLDQSSDPITQV
jgi:hypothetical protein